MRPSEEEALLLRIDELDQRTKRTALFVEKIAEKVGVDIEDVDVELQRRERELAERLLQAKAGPPMYRAPKQGGMF
jgi:hypothetical protein